LVDFVKQYIAQCLSAASNNLRLNNQQIEVIALLRETIIKSASIENDIKNMKKITELSTLAIRLNEIFTYLTQHQIDFFRLSDKFREQSQMLVKDLNRTLETITPAILHESMNKLKTNSAQEITSAGIKETLTEEEFRIGETKKNNRMLVENVDLDVNKNDKHEIVTKVEDIHQAAEISFQEYEEKILKPIKPLDLMLIRLSNDDVSADELNWFADLMKSNGILSSKIGFEIISAMHNIFSNALKLIKTRDLMPGREIIESMRACLIVIVAVIKGKEIDITAYLNKAEDFGKQIQTLKIKEK